MVVGEECSTSSSGSAQRLPAEGSTVSDMGLVLPATTSTVAPGGEMAAMVPALDITSVKTGSADVKPTGSVDLDAAAGELANRASCVAWACSRRAVFVPAVLWTLSVRE